MPNGVKAGERRGGRKKGTPNRATQERALLAKRVLEEQQGKPGRKLAREVLDEFMHLFFGMAAQHQPLAGGALSMKGQRPDEAKFLMFAKLAIETAAQLAPYQSPKLKATFVSQEVPAVGSRDVAKQSTSKPMTAMQAYRMFRDSSDLIELPSAAPMDVGKK
jgi:hypothetical protein